MKSKGRRRDKKECALTASYRCCHAENTLTPQIHEDSTCYTVIGSSELSYLRPAVLQEWLPSRDNVVFLIDAQAAMFQCAGLTQTAVRPLHIRHSLLQGNYPESAGAAK